MAELARVHAGCYEGSSAADEETVSKPYARLVVSGTATGVGAEPEEWRGPDLEETLPGSEMVPFQIASCKSKSSKNPVSHRPQPV